MDIDTGPSRVMTSKEWGEYLWSESAEDRVEMELATARATGVYRTHEGHTPRGARLWDRIGVEDCCSYPDLLPDTDTGYWVTPALVQADLTGDCNG